MSEDCNAAIAGLDRRVTTLEARVGETGDDGIRGDVRDVKKNLRSMELRLYVAGGAALSVIWLLEHFVGPALR